MNPNPPQLSGSANRALSARDASAPAPWSPLRRLTTARLALGRSGGSLPTREVLAFALDHALARDAVQAPFDAEALAAELRALPDIPDILVLNTAATDRTTYLQRPDLGRRLSETSVAQLATAGAGNPNPHHKTPAGLGESPATLALIVSDGLSALAAHRQVPALLRELLPRLHTAGFILTPICVVRHARVGLIDEVGSLLRADFALILLGERPGLGTPDNLSAYFTRAPAPGHTDADRNCVSNISPAGLPPVAAAIKLAAWLTDARTQGRSGVALKEPLTAAPAKSITEPPARITC